MRKQSTVDLDKPFAGKSKKEHVSGTRPLDKEGNPKSGPLFGGIRIEEAITIDRPVEQLYNYWRDFTNLPRFCKYLRAVVVLDIMRSRWTVDGPANKQLTWEAAIIDDRPNELISWRSLENSEFDNAGSVRFRPAPGNRGTEVVLTMTYNPPAGPLGSLIAKLTAKEPSFLLKEQLRRFKQLMETGEIATTDGQAAVIE
jgi:uncharacterized membrane protein